MSQQTHSTQLRDRWFDLGYFDLRSVLDKLVLANHSTPANRAMWPFAAKTPPPVVLYTRRGCHLCDDAKALLIKHGLTPEEVDIDQVPEWRDRYNTCVPVVVIDGRERFRGRVDEVLLRRLLRGRRA